MDCRKTCRRSCTSYCRASRSHDGRRHKTGPRERPGLRLQNTSHPPERVSKSEWLQSGLPSDIRSYSSRCCRNTVAILKTERENFSLLAPGGAGGKSRGMSMREGQNSAKGGGGQLLAGPSRVPDI